jgi:hypothetical protein
MTAVAAAVLMLTAVRAARGPAAFARYFGLPLATDPGFVRVYAARSAFIAVFAAVLLVRRDLPALTVFTLTAVLLPVADAALVRRAGAGTPTVVRHLAIAAFLLSSSILLWRGV